MKKVLCVIGTRPEAVKMAPVVSNLRVQGWGKTVVVATGQHREILHRTLDVFGITPDIDLEVMQTNQSLAGLTARVSEALDHVLVDEKPDLVLAQGDTTSVMVCALVCFYRRIPFGHVEAGLRTHDLQNPFPEEFNRVAAGRLASIHFAPTDQSKRNLLEEGIDPASIHVTGNTVIDALLEVASRDFPLDIEVDPSHRLVLVTAHRRENFGRPLLDICAAIRTLHERFEDVSFIYPVHPNPNVQDVVRRELAGLARVSLVPPVGYTELVGLLKRSAIALTDSGGIQEEAPALGKPVLVLRKATERPEAVAAGVAKLVGTETDVIVSEVSRLLTDERSYADMAKGASPYGDGRSGQRIATLSAELLGVKEMRVKPASA